MSEELRNEFKKLIHEAELNEAEACRLRGALGSLRTSSDAFWQKMVDLYGDEPNWQAYALSQNIGDANRLLGDGPPVAFAKAPNPTDARSPESRGSSDSEEHEE